MTPVPIASILVRLRQALGAIPPWPAEGALEYVCGAVLVQNTAWDNVERSLENLRHATGFDARRLEALDLEELQSLIRPSGFMTAKARAVRAYAAWSLSGEGSDAVRLDDGGLRTALLSLPGFGPETADVVALMAFGRRRFIFDTYGRRMLRQAGYVFPDDYERARRALESSIDAAALTHVELVELHGLILEAGKRARAAGGWELYGPEIGVVPAP